MRTIRDVMTPNPVCCPADATIQVVAEKMRLEDTGFIPLVDTKTGKLCGVITDRDLAVRAVYDGADPFRATARDYCSENLATIAPDAKVEDAIHVMEDRHVRRLIVMVDGRPVGVVSLGDLAETAPKLAEEVLVEISKSPKTLAHHKKLAS